MPGIHVEASVWGPVAPEGAFELLAVRLEWARAPVPFLKEVEIVPNAGDPDRRRVRWVWSLGGLTLRYVEDQRLDRSALHIRNSATNLVCFQSYTSDALYVPERGGTRVEVTADFVPVYTPPFLQGTMRPLAEKALDQAMHAMHGCLARNPDAGLGA